MFVKIENNIIQSYSKTEMPGGIYTTTEGLSGGMIVKEIIGDVIIAEKPLEQLKQEQIILFKEIEKQATGKRAEYLTAEMLPEGAFKDLKLAKLKAEGDEIKSNYEKAMFELVSKYGNGIIEELL